MDRQNPVLPGFRPDPTICRSGEQFYLATSSFAYFPGVPLYRSGNLLEWEPIGHALDRESQLDTRGAAPTGGIWAPTLRHHDGTFYLTTTDTSGDGHLVVTADDPGGEWSEPIYVDAPGFDPDLFWDDETPYFTYYSGSGERGIEGAEIDLATGDLGQRQTVWTGLADPHAEAPHLFERDGVYYLVVAEGGTHTGHSVVVARSDDPMGPFEPHPDNPILTHREDYQRDVRAVGHADLVTDTSGQWWLVCLGIRPRGGFPGWHHLGRETFLAPVAWRDGWPVVEGGDLPETIDADLPGETPSAGRTAVEHTDTDFAEGRGHEWVWRRTPDRSRYVFTADGLVIRGGPETLDERGVTFLGRRQTTFECRIRADLSFAPFAGDEVGLAVVMDGDHHYEIGVHREDGEQRAVVRIRIGNAVDRLGTRPVEQSATLGIDADAEHYRFLIDGDRIASARTKYLSTEVAGGFTGVTIGPYATGNGEECSNPARVERFVYEPTGDDA